MAEFLLDENVLGLDRYLTGIKYKKIGDEGCPAKLADAIKLYVSANFKSFKINYRLD